MPPESRPAEYRDKNHNTMTEERTETTAPSRAKTIVFVEDEPALQKTLGEYLRAQGYAVVSALDGDTGYQAIVREKPDLILLDLILPRMHGLELLAAIRGDRRIGDIPVIVLTNVEDSSAVEKAIRLGAKAYLVKTDYDLGEVQKKIEEVLAEKQ